MTVLKWFQWLSYAKTYDGLDSVRRITTLMIFVGTYEVFYGTFFLIGNVRKSLCMEQRYFPILTHSSI